MNGSERRDSEPAPFGSDRVVDLGWMLILLVVLSGLLIALPERWMAGLALLLGSVGAVLFGRRRGYRLVDLGLAPADVRSGVRLGGALSALVVAGVAALASIPAARSFFDDDRFDGADPLAVGLEAGVRIPLVTALGEELLFRAVLLAVLVAMTSRLVAIAGSSLAFGLWHVPTTLSGLDGNAATGDLSTVAQLGAVFGVVVATGLAGAVFAWLRLRSGSLVAPWLVHTTINASTYVAGAVLVSGGHV